MSDELGNAGPLDVQEHIALLIADEIDTGCRPTAGLLRSR